MLFEALNSTSLHDTAQIRTRRDLFRKTESLTDQRAKRMRGNLVLPPAGIANSELKVKSRLPEKNLMLFLYLQKKET